MTRFWDGRTDGQTDGVTALLDLLSPSANGLTQIRVICVRIFIMSHNTSYLPQHRAVNSLLSLKQKLFPFKNSMQYFFNLNVAAEF